MESERCERFEAARQAVAEMNLLAWQRWPRRRTEAEVNAEVENALDALARNGQDIFPDKEKIAEIQAKNYAGIGSQPGDPDGVKERPKEATPELQKRMEFADRLVKEINRQAWLDTGMTEAEYDESERCEEAFHLLYAYGYDASGIERDEPAATPYSPVIEKELAARK